MPKKSESLAVRQSPGLVEAFQNHQVSKQVATIQRDAFLERAQVAAERDLATLKMADITALARQGMADARDIADDMVAEIEANPYAAQAVTRLASTASSGLERELRRFIEGR
jgi:hypothetical protein